MGEPALAVRLCPTHLKPLDVKGSSLACPVGGHAVSRWKVVNARTGRAMYDADEDKVTVTPAKDGLRPVAVPAAAEPAAKVVPKKKQAKYPRNMILTQRLDDGCGLVLYIRLYREGVGKTWYRVRFERYESGGGAGSGAKPNNVFGVNASVSTEQDGRDAFEAAVADALKQGWSKTVGTPKGGPRVHIKPIPAPRKRA